jgi:hypothetical protein
LNILLYLAQTIKSTDATAQAAKVEIKPPTATQVAMKVFKEKGFFGFYKG